MQRETTELSNHTQKIGSDIIVDNGGGVVTGLNPTNSQQYWHLAQIFHKGNANPTLKNPFEYMVIMAYGAELGFSAIISLANCALINGKPSVFGKGLMSKITEAGYRITEKFENDMYDGEDYNRNYKIVAKLINPEGEEIAEDEYSIGDAVRAGLWVSDEMVDGNSKDAWKHSAKPWRKHPKRMMKWRARGFLIGDHLSHLFLGATIAEVMDDDQVTIAENVGSTLGTAASKIENMASAKISDDVEDAEFVDLDEIIEGEPVGTKPVEDKIIETEPAEDVAAKLTDKFDKEKSETLSSKNETKDGAVSPSKDETAKAEPKPVKDKTAVPDKAVAEPKAINAKIDSAQLKGAMIMLKSIEVDPPEWFEELIAIEPAYDAMNDFYFNGKGKTAVAMEEILEAHMKFKWFLELPKEQRIFTKKILVKLAERVAEKEQAELDAAAAKGEKDEPAEAAAETATDPEPSEDKPETPITSDMMDWLEFVDGTAISADNIRAQWSEENKMPWALELNDVQMAWIEDKNQKAIDRFEGNKPE